MFGQEGIVTKEFILKRVSEEDIFKRYLGIEPNLIGTYRNPKRDDGRPGCGFYVDSRGVWKFKDFAGGFNWDCFNVVEWDYGITFKQALIKIAGDFNLIDTTTNSYQTISRVTRVKRILGLRVQRRAWTKADYEWWYQYYITPERLEFFKVHPIEFAWFVENGVLRKAYVNTPNNPAYVYHFNDMYDYKIYLPFGKQGRFIHTNSTIIQGYEQLPEFAKNLIITKSYKDVMCFDLFRDFDLYSIAPMSETILISQEAFVDLYNRFDMIATNFDFDRAGIRLMRRYEQMYKLPYFMFGKQYKSQGIKDFADHIKIKGIDETRRLIERYVESRNRFITNDSPF